MLRRTWYTTHFPYTTLFRSKQRTRIVQLLRLQPFEITGEDQREIVQFAGELRVFVQPVCSFQKHVRRHTVALQLAEDRKSTRLNSSHLVISYAVICLKK